MTTGWLITENVTLSVGPGVPVPPRRAERSRSDDMAAQRECSGVVIAIRIAKQGERRRALAAEVGVRIEPELHVFDAARCVRANVQIRRGEQRQIDNRARLNRFVADLPTKTRRSKNGLRQCG